MVGVGWKVNGWCLWNYIVVNVKMQNKIWDIPSEFWINRQGRCKKW